MKSLDINDVKDGNVAKSSSTSAANNSSSSDVSEGLHLFRNEGGTLYV